MAQTSSPFQQIAHTLQNRADLSPFADSLPLQPQIHRWVKAGTKRRWVVICFGAGMFTAWQGLLVTAAIAGLLAGVSTYRLQQGQWKAARLLWRRLWKPNNRALTLAVGVGTMATLLTYGILSAETTGSPALAIAMLQTCGAAVVLAGFIWMRSQPGRSPSSPNDPSPHLDHLLNGLADPTPLKRLMAIRRITHSLLNLPQEAGPPELRSHVVDCFQMMLKHETDAILRATLVSSLQQLQAAHGLPEGSPELALPLSQAPAHAIPEALPVDPLSAHPHQAAHTTGHHATGHAQIDIGLHGSAVARE